MYKYVCALVVETDERVTKRALRKTIEQLIDESPAIWNSDTANIIKARVRAVDFD